MFITFLSKVHIDLNIPKPKCLYILHVLQSICLFFQKVLACGVIEQGTFVKHFKVEVYLMDIKLCENSNMDVIITKKFSRACTIGNNIITRHYNIIVFNKNFVCIEFNGPFNTFQFRSYHDGACL